MLRRKEGILGEGSNKRGAKAEAKVSPETVPDATSTLGDDIIFKILAGSRFHRSRPIS